MRNYLVIFNFFLIVLISCSKDKIIQEKTKESTIYEIIDNDINYSILSTALRITKLDEVLKSDDVKVKNFDGIKLIDQNNWEIDII